MKNFILSFFKRKKAELASIGMYVILILHLLGYIYPSGVFYTLGLFIEVIGFILITACLVLGWYAQTK